jgi:hypothetical protein
MIQPRQFRITAWLCLAIAALDLVVSLLPHSHAGLSAACSHGECVHAHAESAPHSHGHAGCSHSHTCSHRACEQAPPAESSQVPSDRDVPCDHCAICRHQAQPALNCTTVVPPAFHAACELLPVQQFAQRTPSIPDVYEGRGPPAWL